MKKVLFVGALVLLVFSLSLPATAAPNIIYSGIDIWATRGDGRTFTDFKFEPIPAGFFCANSAPFEGRIAFQGAPIATGEGYELNKTDTIVHRLDDAVFDKRGRAATRIQFRALSLVSMVPIQTSCGQFNVKAVLDGEQPITRMRIFRENDKGGFFIAPLALNVKLLFTPVNRPNARPLVLKQNVRFNSNPPQPWASDVTRRSFVHEDPVKVDTDGDGTPDTSLPGTSNFAAGLGAQTKMPINCHMYYDESGLRKMHCLGEDTPVE
jgi:hypothetical protein